MSVHSQFWCVKWEIKQLWGRSLSGYAIICLSNFDPKKNAGIWFCKSTVCLRIFHLIEDKHEWYCSSMCYKQSVVGIIVFIYQWVIWKKIENLICGNQNHDLPVFPPTPPLFLIWTNVFFASFLGIKWWHSCPLSYVNNLTYKYCAYFQYIIQSQYNTCNFL